MKKRTKNILFFGLVALFLLLAPSLVLYSQGWRLDFNPPDGGIIRFTQTGAFYFKVWPRSVEVYLDNELEKRTDFFFGSTLIESLLPRTYPVTISKEGYHPWQKNLTIQKKLVTEAKNIVLIPKQPSFSVLTRNLKDFWFSPDSRKIILLEGSNDESWSLKLFEPERNVKSHLADRQDFSEELFELPRVEFLENSRNVRLTFKADEEEQEPHYFVMEIDEVPPTITEDPDFLPSENESIQIKAWQDTYLLNEEGRLIKNEEELIRGGVKGMELSPDSRKLTFFSDHEIWVLFLRSTDDQPRKKAGDDLLLVRLSERINQVFWYTSHYLVFSANDKIKIAEIDDRNRINVIELELPDSIGRITRIFFSQTDKKLYILNEEQVFYASEKLLP